MRTTHNERPVAVVSAAPSAAAPLLRRLLGCPVEELNPYDLAMERSALRPYGAVVVENVVPERVPGPLSECAAVQWLLPPSPLTVVSLDDPAGRRLARWRRGGVVAYSDGDPRADVTAKNVNLRWGRLEFDALTQTDLIRVRLAPDGTADLYGALAALTCALGLGMPLDEAAARLSAALE